MFRGSGFIFLALLGFALLGFSESYFFNFDDSFPLFVHLHVLFVGGWILLITGQAFFIRGGQLAAHRQMGEISYVLAPAIVISGIYLARSHYYERIGSVGLESNLEFLWWALSHFALFGLFFCLAIIYRKNASRHARFMIIATLLFVSPTLVRVFDVIGLSIADVSRIDLSFIATDLILLVLLAADIGAKRSAVPFAAGLSAFTFVQVATRYAAENPGWRYVARLIVGS